MTAEIITIGDELLIGQVVNTNQAFIAERLNSLGVSVSRMVTVGDSMDDILSALHDGWSRHAVTIVTGGLGPTHDDITKTAVCRFFETPLRADDGLRRHIEGLLLARGMAWSAAAEHQALVPASATLLPNPLGTAAGLLFHRGERMLVVLPGVPYEMRAIVEESVIPFIRSRIEGSVILHRTLRTTGATESALAQALGPLDELLGGATLAFLPSPRGVRLRLSARAADTREAEALISGAEHRLRARVGDFIYGTDGEDLEAVVGRMMADRGWTIALAESCTGGLISDRLTNVGGSSAYLQLCIVAYSNRSKSDLLGVPEELIREHGAVSEPVARAMAEGARRSGGSTVAISTTGIAGPTGGTPEKPVGLVWIGYAGPDDSTAQRFNLGGDRLLVKERASQAALTLLWRRLLALP